MFSASSDASSAEVYKFENDEWVQIGPNLNLNTAFHTSFAVSPEGVPYVADRSTVYRYESGTWTLVGAPFMAGGTIIYPDIAFNTSGDLYAVATSSSSSSATNRCFKWDGESWQQVGEDVSAVAVWNKLSFDASGSPLALYGSGGPWQFYAEVSAFDGTSWNILGGGQINPDEWTRWAFDIVATSGNQIFAINSSSEERILDLYLYDDSTDSWEIHTPEIAAGIEDFSASIIVDQQDRLYVAYNDVSVGGGVSVQRFDDNEWTYLGVQGFTPPARDIAITLTENDIPVVGYIDILEGERISAKKYVDLTTTNTNQIEVLSGIHLFPNPANDNIIIEFEAAEFYEIYNAAGQIVTSGLLSGIDGELNKHEIDLFNIRTGLYFMRIIDGRKSATLKFVKAN